MRLFLGIDIGGTKTECVVGGESSVLGFGSAASSKLSRVGEEPARAALHAAIHQACHAAGVDARAMERTCVGMAGASRHDAVAAVRRLVAEIVPGEIVVVGDMEVAHHAAFADGPGVMVIAGTGSIAYGRNQRGETARAGGWGPAISDEGSGEWIGRLAVGGAMRAHESGRGSLLIASVMNTWHLATRDDVSRVANAYPPPDFAALFPQVVAAADANDDLAHDLLVRAGHELAQLAMIVVRRLWPGPNPIAVAMYGGVFQNSSVVREVFANILAKERSDATVALCSRRAAEGALALACKAAAREGVGP